MRIIMKMNIANKSLIFLFLTILVMDATSEDTKHAIEEYSGNV